MATDPGRLATYRALARARAACVGSGACAAHDPVLRNFTRFVAKNAEHTQGVQGNGNAPGSQLCIWTTALHLRLGHLCYGDTYWANERFASVHSSKHNVFHGADDSWLEDRLFNRLAIEAVPAAHPLAAALRAELAALEPALPGSQARPLAPGAPPPMLTCRGATGASAGARFTASGSIASLSFGGAGRAAWTRLMDLRYVTSSKCGTCTCEEAGCANPVPGAWAPSLLGVWSAAQPPPSGLGAAAGGAAAGGAGGCEISLELGFNETLSRKYGAPARVIARYRLDPDARRLEASLTWLNKSATRLPEALTLFHRPARAGHAWAVDTLGEWVSPANVTPGGEQWMHAVWSGIRYASIGPESASGRAPTAAAAAAARPGLYVSSLDAGMACPVLNTAANRTLAPDEAMQMACFEYEDFVRHTLHSTRAPQLSDAAIDGLGINLFNNRLGISGFPQWYPFGLGDRYQARDETTQFRFVIEER